MKPVAAAVELIVQSAVVGKVTSDGLPLSLGKWEETGIATERVERWPVVERLVRIVQFAPTIVPERTIVLQVLLNEYVDGCVHLVDKLSL